MVTANETTAQPEYAEKSRPPLNELDKFQLFVFQNIITRDLELAWKVMELMHEFDPTKYGNGE